jgi:hypothetical protein
LANAQDFINRFALGGCRWILTDQGVATCRWSNTAFDKLDPGVVQAVLYAKDPDIIGGTGISAISITEDEHGIA